MPAQELLDDDPFEAFNRSMGAFAGVDPYVEYATLRAQGPIVEVAPSLFQAASFEAVHEVLHDGARFSSSGYAEVMGPVMGHTILEMDEPEHHAYRVLIQKAFTRNALKRWEHDLVARVIDERIDRFVDGGRVDLVSKLLLPFPVDVIAGLLGLPAADLPLFHRLSVELISVTVDMEVARRGSRGLAEYLLPIIRQRRADPADDMISVLVTAEHDGQTLTDDEVLAFCRLLLPAGAETTYRSSSNLLTGLLTHPEQLAAVAADRTLVPQAIEEALRWEPPLLMIMRTASADTEVQGVPVPAGSGILVLIGSANRDESRWPDAARFDIFREQQFHIAFASGPHTCLGLHLARMETAVVLDRAFERLPGLRLDPDAAAPAIVGSTFRAPLRLDVTWG